MSLLIHLGPALDYIKNLRHCLPNRLVGLSTTQKVRRQLLVVSGSYRCSFRQVVVVSVTASVAIVGVLARYMRRKKQVDPTKFRKNFFKRPRISGVRSPNGGNYLWVFQLNYFCIPRDVYYTKAIKF